MVGIIPALAAAVIDGDMLRRAMTLNKGFMGFLEHEGFRDIRGKLAETPQLRGERGHERLLLSVARPGQLERPPKAVHQVIDGGGPCLADHGCSGTISSRPW